MIYLKRILFLLAKFFLIGFATVTLVTCCIFEPLVSAIAFIFTGNGDVDCSEPVIEKSERTVQKIAKKLGVV